MKRYLFYTILVLMLASCFLLLGCDRVSSEKGALVESRPDLVSVLDYSDWYGDDANTAIYNYTKWIELDVWCTEELSEYDWTDVCFDVYYEDQIVAQGIPAVFKFDYIICRFDASCEGAVLTSNGFLAPGSYRIVLKDDGNHEVESSTCNVKIESGDILSQMVTGVEVIENNEKLITLRFMFSGDISFCSKIGFYIKVSIDGGEEISVPPKYSIEPADTFLTVKYYNPDNSSSKIIMYLFCKDESFVYSTEIEV